MESSPPRPQITSAEFVPVRMSLPEVPQMVHVAPTTRLRTGTVTVRCWPEGMIPIVQDSDVAPDGCVQPTGNDPLSANLASMVPVRTVPGASFGPRFVTMNESEKGVPVPTVGTGGIVSFRSAPTACRVNVAVTDFAASTVTRQAPVPVQPPPDQPVNTDPASAVAVNVTAVPSLTVTVHVAPQSMPAGLDVTEPVPAPARCTDNAYC